MLIAMTCHPVGESSGLCAAKTGKTSHDLSRSTLTAVDATSLVASSVVASETAIDGVADTVTTLEVTPSDLTVINTLPTDLSLSIALWAAVPSLSAATKEDKCDKKKRHRFQNYSKQTIISKKAYLSFTPSLDWAGNIYRRVVICARSLRVAAHCGAVDHVLPVIGQPQLD